MCTLKLTSVGCWHDAAGSASLFWMTSDSFAPSLTGPEKPDTSFQARGVKGSSANMTCRGGRHKHRGLMLTCSRERNLACGQASSWCLRHCENPLTSSALLTIKCCPSPSDDRVLPQQEQELLQTSSLSTVCGMDCTAWLSL